MEKDYNKITDDERHILIWLPVMKELEHMGYDPIELLFGRGHPNMKEVEASYKAISICKKKYPEWYEVVSEYIDKLMIGMNL